MAAPLWQAGTFYAPGDLVQPVTAPSPTVPQVENGSFASGAAGWTFTGAAAYVATGGYGGGGCVQLPGSQPDGLALNDTELVVDAGGKLSATAMIQQGASIARATSGWVEVQWFDGLGTVLKVDKGNVVDDGSGGAWHQSRVESTKPTGASYARAGIHLTSVADHSHPIWGDSLVVSGASAGLPEGLIYKAVQPESATSGSSEPAWPGILGQQVEDGEVIWEAVTTSRVTWTASPRYVSGTDEPAWPNDIGAMVQDGSINWRAISRRVEDPKCPQSKVVAIVASKVFAADGDIVRFSATANPLDWTTAEDAGYLPTGLQQANANNIAVLVPYRGNLAPMNASSFQNWQMDPDPASMALIDQMDGIGSVWQRAAVPVANDLLYLSQQGVRTIGIANAAENLASGDVGAPIDELVRDAMRVASAAGSRVLATYYPGAGQYWLSFSDYPPPALSLHGNLPGGLVGQRGAGAYVPAGGVKPYGAVVVVAGQLPPGVVLAADGTYTYQFSALGEYAWTVAVTDADGNVATLADSASVTNQDVWLVRGGGNTPTFMAGLAGGAWTLNQPDGLSGASYVWADKGIFHVSDGVTTAYRYSTDRGRTWRSAGNPQISSGGGRMAFAGDYAFIAAGANAFLRRSLPDGQWQVVSVSGYGAASDVAVIEDSVLLVYWTVERVKRSVDAAMNFVLAGQFAAQIPYSDQRIASDGERVVVAYKVADGSNLELRYSDDQGVSFAPEAYRFPLPSNADLPAVLVHDGEYWIAITQHGHVLYSPDGAAWTVSANKLPTGVVQGAAAMSTALVACGSNGLWQTFDHGQTWSQRPLVAGQTTASGVAWIDPTEASS